jgi:transmembrane 9 superfamily protein 2/4
MPPRLVVLLLICLHFLPPLHGTLLLGPQPQTYAEQAPIPLKVNKITSTRTGVPYPYYSLPFCKPNNTNYNLNRDIPTTLRGDHLEDSLYEVRPSP